jgi:hypothetical protein
LLARARARPAKGGATREKTARIIRKSFFFFFFHFIFRNECVNINHGIIKMYILFFLFFKYFSPEILIFPSKNKTEK